MHPENGYKVLFNEGTLCRKEIFVETLKNLKRQRFYQPPSLTGNNLVPFNVAHIAYAGDNRSADRLAARMHIKKILNLVSSPAQPGSTEDLNNSQDDV